VLVESPRGSVKINASVLEGIEPRVVHMHHGFPNENCNILIDSEACDPIIGASPLKGALCRVTKIEG